MLNSLFFAALIAITGPEVEVGTVDGSSKSGELKELSTEHYTPETSDGITADQILFRVDGETIPVKRVKVDGLVFAHKTSDKLPEAVASVEDNAGWCVKAKAISLEHGQLKVTTLSGDQLDRPIDSVLR